MRRCLAGLSARLRAADAMICAGGAPAGGEAAECSSSAATAAGARALAAAPHFADRCWQQQLPWWQQQRRWASSEGASSSSSATAAEASTSSSSGGAGDAPPPQAPPEGAPAFTSGARLVQPLRRGGAAVAAQEGIVHINCSLNNTFVVLTDLGGSVKTYTSGGSVGFKNAGKASPLAAERAAAELGRRALEKGFYSVSVRLKGVGRNKQIAVQALAAAGVGVTQLREVTPTPYNGCRLPRKRRV